MSSELPRILLVDDEPIVLALMGRALAEAGYEVLPASNGLEALAAALRQAHPNLPIMFVSGFKQGPAPTLPRPLLAKPFTPDELVSALGCLLAAPVPSRHASA